MAQRIPSTARERKADRLLREAIRAGKVKKLSNCEECGTDVNVKPRTTDRNEVKFLCDSCNEE